MAITVTKLLVPFAGLLAACYLGAAIAETHSFPQEELDQLAAAEIDEQVAPNEKLAQEEDGEEFQRPPPAHREYADEVAASIEELFEPSSLEESSLSQVLLERGAETPTSRRRSSRRRLSRRRAPPKPDSVSVRVTRLEEEMKKLKAGVKELLERIPAPTPGPLPCKEAKQCALEACGDKEQGDTCEYTYEALKRTLMGMCQPLQTTGVLHCYPLSEDQVACQGKKLEEFCEKKVPFFHAPLQGACNHGKHGNHGKDILHCDYYLKPKEAPQASACEGAKLRDDCKYSITPTLSFVGMCRARHSDDEDLWCYPYSPAYAACFGKTFKDPCKLAIAADQPAKTGFCNHAMIHKKALFHCDVGWTPTPQDSACKDLKSKDDCMYSIGTEKFVGMCRPARPSNLDNLRCFPYSSTYKACFRKKFLDACKLDGKSGACNHATLYGKRLFHCNLGLKPVAPQVSACKDSKSKDDCKYTIGEKKFLGMCRAPDKSAPDKLACHPYSPALAACVGKRFKEPCVLQSRQGGCNHANHFGKDLFHCDLGLKPDSGSRRRRRSPR